MYHVSSNLTIFLKFFLPTFWIVFFGLFTVAVMADPSAYFGNIPAFLFKVGVITFYLLGILLAYMYPIRLKRVEMEAEHVYVSNYFKTFRYTWEDVRRFHHFDLVLFRFVRIQLKAPGTFGRGMTFVASRKRLREFALAHPEQGAMIYPDLEDQ